MNPAYPVEFKTLGDHLRKTRLDKWLAHGDVANILLVDADTVTTWEMNRHQPTAKFAVKYHLVSWIYPFRLKGQSLGRHLYSARLITGKTQKQVANMIGCDVSTLKFIELDRSIPLPPPRTLNKVQDYVDIARLQCN